MTRGLMKIEEISAYIEIQQVLYRYSRGVDRGDAELIKSVYHPEAIDEHGLFNGAGMEFADLIVKEMGRCTANGAHHITNILIDLDGDTAKVESYFFALNPETEPEGTVSPVSGRYLDRFEQRNGEWKIAHRKVILDWSHSALPVSQWPLHKKFPNGKKNEKDASYEFFRNKNE